MKFKDYFNTAYARLLSDKIAAVYDEFPAGQFVDYVTAHIDDKAFNERQDLIVDALEKTLPSSYEKCIALFTSILGPELQQETGMFSDGWWLWPFGRYVERNGLKNPALSLAFIEELTKRFTGEYAIRPLLKAHPREVMDELIAWTNDKNVHVRRLASEGVRIRLPWSQKLFVAVEEFERYSTILTNLKDDPEKFVQKSVGNNLNDLYKEAPEKAEYIITQWEKTSQSKAQEWIIKHGMRNQK